MGFSAINIHCNIISGVKDNGKNTDILYTFTLTELQGYLINIMPTNILYQNVTNDRIEYIEFHIKDEHGRPIDFNGDVLGFKLHLILNIFIVKDMVIVQFLSIIIAMDIEII